MTVDPTVYRCADECVWHFAPENIGKEFTDKATKELSELMQQWLEENIPEGVRT